MASIYSGYGDFAEEGMFAFPETTVRGLLQQVRDGLPSKCPTLEQAEQMSARVDVESGEIRKCILDISNVMAQVHNGAISAGEARAYAVPRVQSIKSKCQALGLTTAFSSDDDVCETELEMLNEFITGVRTIMNEYIASLRDLEGSDNAGMGGTLTHGAATDASEGSIMAFMQSGNTAALEGLFDPSREHELILKSNEMQTADKLFAQAKKIHKFDPEKGVETMKKAMQLYTALLAKAKKLAQRKNGTLKLKNRVGSNSASLQTNETIYRKMQVAVNTLETKIDSCEAWLGKWENDGGRAGQKELAQQLREERRGAKAAWKSARKEAKAAAKAARKAAKNGDPEAAAEALTALAQYALAGEVDYSDPAMVAFETYLDTNYMEEV